MGVLVHVSEWVSVTKFKHFVGHPLPTLLSTHSCTGSLDSAWKNWRPRTAPCPLISSTTHPLPYSRYACVYVCVSMHVYVYECMYRKYPILFHFHDHFLFHQTFLQSTNTCLFYLQFQSVSAIRSSLSVVDDVLRFLDNPRFRQLLEIKHSKRFGGATSIFSLTSLPFPPSLLNFSLYYSLPLFFVGSFPVTSSKKSFLTFINFLLSFVFWWPIQHVDMWNV